LLAPHFAFAPFTNYFVLDPWLPLLPANCSALRFVHPAASTDLTRCRPLSALLRSRIAPRSLHCARAVGGSPRLTDHSVFSTWNSGPPADCSACDTFCTVPLSDRSALDTLPCAPLPDRSALDAWPAVPVYGLLRTLTLCALVPFQDCSVPDT